MMKPLATLLFTSSLFAPVGHAATRAEAAVAEVRQLKVARQQTAAAFLKTVSRATMRQDIDILANLGEIQTARRMLAKLPPSAVKAGLTSNIARDAAIVALADGHLEVAEREIRLAHVNQYDLAKLWISLSRQYSQAKRFPAARRTAFYAWKQVQEGDLGNLWPDVAAQLCAVGDKAAARRIFAVAKRNLLETDPLFGSPLDQVVEAAARCGFDDIAFETRSAFPFQAVAIWGAQGRDDVAYRFIDHQEKVLLELSEEAAKKKPGYPSKGTPAQAKFAGHMMGLLLLAEGQLVRGDIGVATRTYEEMDTLLDANPDYQEWLIQKLQNLDFYESTGQWALADKDIEAIESYLEKNQSSDSKAAVTSRRNRESLQRGRLRGLNVIFHPKKYDLAKRREAYERIRPLLLEAAQSGPAAKAEATIQLARAQHSLNAPAWHSNLERAQAVIFTMPPGAEKISALLDLGQAWDEVGDKQNFHFIGKQMAVAWRQQPDNLKPRERTGDIVFISFLIYGHHWDEISALLFPKRAAIKVNYADHVTSFARQSRLGPPIRLLTLPLKERREALLLWAKGLALYDALNGVHLQKELGQD